MVAPLAAEHGLQGARASVVVVLGLSSCGSWALERRLDSCGTRALLRFGTWTLPAPEIEPESPALAGGLYPTESQGIPSVGVFLIQGRKYQRVGSRLVSVPP